MKMSGTLIAIALLFLAMEVLSGCASEPTKTGAVNYDDQYSGPASNYHDDYGNH